MEREQVERALPHRLLQIGAVAVLASAGALAFGRVFQGHMPTMKLLATALLSVGVAALLERRGPILAVLGSAVGLLITAGLLVFPKTVAGMFPTADTFVAFDRAIHHVGEQARVQVAPTEALKPLLLAAVTAVWTASFAAHALAIRSGSPLLAALPPASLLAFADVLLDDGARPSYAALFLIGALAVLFMDGLRRVRQWGPLRPWPGSTRHRLASTTATRGARRVALVAVLAALVIPGVLPGFQSPAVLELESGRVLQGPEVNPLVSVTASLKKRKPVPLFLIQSSQPAYWRWMSLDTFDGTRWSSDDLYVDHGQIVGAGSALPQPPQDVPAPGATTTGLDQTIAVLQVPGDWLPMAYRPTSVSVGQASIRYDQSIGAAVPLDGISQGLSYTVRSEITLPTRRDLEAVPNTGFSNPVYAPFRQLPADTPVQIYGIARDLTADAPTPFQKILAIQDYLQTFTYDQSVKGQDIHTVLNFLTVTKRGFCQQFASAMAVLVRALGYPARIGVGFTPGTFEPSNQSWLVTTENAHAWVEVLFPGYGWLAFEPTPNRDNPVADNYLAPGKIVKQCQVHGACGTGTGGSGATRTRQSLQAKILDAQRRRQDLLGSTMEGVAGTTAAPAAGSSRSYRLPLVVLGIGIGLLLALFLLVMPIAKTIVRRGRVVRAGSPREVVLATYRSFTGHAADLGLPRTGGETMREYRDRLQREVRFSDGHVERLTAITVHAAYSADAVSKEEAREALAAARMTIRDMKRNRPMGRRLVGLFRPGL